ncbi:MAG TPA: cupin domain-containing protein [Luteimonas sp.]|nr:cupin domain-containing protein [Luteimonas sp.]
MKHAHLAFGSEFQVHMAVGQVQAAEMTLAPGAQEGGADNRHQGADQWLYVVAGCGVAVVDGREQGLQPGSLIVIERGERHAIRNTGDAPLKTLNLYTPPAYDVDGEPLPPGKP